MSGYGDMRWTGEMHTDWSDQYQRPCIIIPEKGERYTADNVIAHARRMGAIYHEDGPDDEGFVVELRADVGAELWTEEALRRSFKDPVP